MTAKEEIQRLETIYEDSQTLLEEAFQVLEKLESNLDSFGELKDYYFGDDWKADYDASNEGAYADIKHGILSEDAVYNQFVERHELALQMIEMATKILRQN